MNRRLFLHVATPALLLGAVLFCACVAALWSVNRLHAGMSDILSRDVASLRAAHQLESDLRQLRYHSFLYLVEPVRARAEAVKEDQLAFESALARAREVTHERGEIDLLDRLAAGYERYRGELDQAGHEVPALRGPAIARWDDVHPIRHVLAPCHELMRVSCEGMDQTAAESLGVSERTRSALIVLGALGPLSGLVVGFGVARGLNHSIARLRVRLQDVHAHLEEDVGSVKVQADGDLSHLHEQVDQIVDRVRAIVGELNRKREEALRAEQLAAVGQLAASVAHEVRNPLTGIKMIVDVARRDPGGPALNAEDLQVIHTEIERIERRVQGLLDYASPPAARRTAVDLRDTVREALRLIETRLRQQGVRQDVRLPAEPVAALIDVDQVSGVLVNLFLNALDAMPRGGCLTVELTAPSAGGVSLSVTDTGAGVPADMSGRLFKPFASTKPTGTGLGLSTSRRVVEDHGGQLTAANLPQGGARFTVVLPHKRRPAHADAADRG
jgi:signal transduction histidine kinase